MTTTGIQIGGVDETDVTVAAEAVARVLTVACDVHADQETMRVALTALSKFGTVTGTTVSNSHITLGHD